jgi:RNA polymerase primary sigma factor
VARAAGRTNTGLEKLVEQGKSKGFLTYDEVSDALPGDVSSDQIDDVVGALGDEDIEIVDGATQVKIAPKRIAEEEAGEKKIVIGAEREEEDYDQYSKSNDPVRMYLRRMGSVPLLTREGEVEIAKRIEEGELAVFNRSSRPKPRSPRSSTSERQAPAAQDPRQGSSIRDAEDDELEFDEERPTRKHPPHRPGQADRQDSQDSERIEERKTVAEDTRKKLEDETVGDHQG